jgi:hypothetical protein
VARAGFGAGALATTGFGAAGRSFALSSGDSNVTTRRAPYAPATRASERSEGR